MENLENEYWKKTYISKDFLVSNKGRVFNVKKNRLLKICTSAYYPTVYINGKSVLLKKIVATAFVNNPRKYSSVINIDKNKDNNCSSNLIWGEREFAYRDLSHIKKTLLDDNLNGYIDISVDGSINKPAGCHNILKIDKNTGEVLGTYNTTMQASESIGKPHSAISNCIYGRRKSAYGYFWKRE